MQERFRHLDAQCEPGLERSILTTPSCDMFIAQLKEYPHDPETWKLLLDAAETSGDIARICEAYDALLSQYPNTAAAQIEYTKHFLGSPESHGEAEKLLSKFLKVSPSSDLWKLYIDYARRTASGPNKHEVLRKAFVFALDHIGQDRDSGSIWADYILLLQAVVANTPFQAQQKINTLRTVYQHAVRIPLDNVEYLWMQYESFEMELDRITAKKIMKDIFPAHMQARTVLRQLNVHLTRLGKSDRCGIFLPSPATFSAQEHMLIKSWKSYLRWEEANPLEIDTQDRDVLLGRITNAYRLAVIRMRFMSYSWTASVGKTEEAISILKAGLEPNPDSFALTYAYAEVLEKTEVKKDRPDFAKIHSVYERFFGVLRANLARLEAVSYPPESPAQYVNGQGTADVVPANAALTQDIAVLRKEFAEHRKQYSNAWINYMRFARRAQGQKGCRSAFGKARSEDYVGWEVYDAAAMSEYHCNLEHGRAVAARIFETGMKKFGSDVPYVLAHLTYLLTINDENNSRALFERVIGTLTPQDAVPVWELWSQSQYNHEDLEATLELQRRMAKVYPKDSSLKLFAQRHKYYSIDAIADHDLGVKFAGNRNSGSAPSVQSLVGVNPLTRPGNDAKRNGSEPLSNPNKRPPPPLDPRHETRHKRPRCDDLDRTRARFATPQRRIEGGPNALIPSRRDVQQDNAPRLPDALAWFLTQLPSREMFDSPVVDVAFLMETLRTVVIRSTASASSPPSRLPRPQ